MTINVLLVLIAIVCLVVRPGKRAPLVVFILPAIAFQVAVSAGVVPDSLFFITGSALDALVVSLLVRLNRTGYMSVFLGAISVLSICGNVFGWMSYEAGLPGTAYDELFVGVYAAVLLAALTEWYCGPEPDAHGFSLRGGSYERH